MLGFDTFNGERIKLNYIKHCKPKTCMAMQTKNIDDLYPIRGIAFIF